MLHELEDREQGQPPGRIGWLSAIWIQIGKKLILVDGSESVAKMDIDISLWKDCTYDSNRFRWDIRDRLRFHGHGGPPALHMILSIFLYFIKWGALPDFATNINVSKNPSASGNGNGN